jgi:hypothetical protein
MLLYGPNVEGSCEGGCGGYCRAIVMVEEPLEGLWDVVEAASQYIRQPGGYGVLGVVRPGGC